MQTDDAAYSSFVGLVENHPPHEAVAMLKSLQIPAGVLDEILKLYDAETTKILTLKEPPAAYGRENARPWYTGPQSKDRNWPAFKSQLAKKLSLEAVEVIDKASDKVVAMLDHPATPEYRSRGLVIGHVQSGKTSNFTAVIAKAADRGYQMFIVLSGIHNALRSQTQGRLINDLVELNKPIWHQLTEIDKDFYPRPNPAAFFSAKDQKLLLVVKKNGPVLKKLRKWLVEAKELLGNCPTLIIDDEADQATVATKVINPLITDIIHTLPRSCYVGYTATPFANLLIDPTAEKDFYPKDFLLSLPRGVDYQGAEELFGREPLDGEDPSDVPGGADMIREIPEDEVDLLRPGKGQANSFSPAVTPSFRRAVLWYWLATAARKARGEAHEHSSMLIHAHSNTKVHDSFKEPLTTLQGGIAAALAAGHPALDSELRKLWDEEIDRVKRGDSTPAVGFSDVMKYFAEVVTSTRIVMDHYRSPDRLDYGKGPVNVIAVGGNTLSRGLTLEGLVVSFFVRSADVYDTLLQMSRWFGYRPGYEDLPRIFLPSELRQWFAHLATVEAELRREIDRLLVEHKTPLQLATRIRCHPKMRVTAPSKMGAAVHAAAAYGGQLVETRYFLTEPERSAKTRIDRNDVAVRALLAAASQAPAIRDTTTPAGRVLWRDVPVEAVRSFIDAYIVDDRSTDISSDLMLEYIDRRNKKSALLKWNVGVVGNAPSPSGPVVGLPGSQRVAPVTRTRLLSSQNDAVADIKTLTGSRDAALDLTPPSSKPLSRTELNLLRREQQADKGLLLLYPINPRSGQGGDELKENRAPLGAPGDDVVWGVAFVFPEPRIGDDSEVEYNYVQADLSKVFPASIEDDESDAEEAAILDEDQDVEAPAA